MRSLPKSFLPILMVLVLLLNGSLRGEGTSHSEQLPQQKSSTQPTSTPANGNTNVPTEQESPQPLYAVHDHQEIKVIVPPVTLTKDHFDYAVPIVNSIFTGLLIFVGFMQWRTYVAQKEIQRQQTILTHRPRLRVREVHLVGTLAIGQPIEVCLSLVNYGETQATIISSNFTVQLWHQTSTPHKQLTDEFQLPEVYDGELHYFEEWLERKTIGAGFMTRPIRKKRALPLQPEEWQQFATHGKTVWAFGYIFYQNDAGQHHRMGFCFRYQKDAGRFSRSDPPDPDLDYEY